MKIIIVGLLLCLTGFAGEYVRKTIPTKFAKGRYHKPQKAAQNTLQRTNRIPIPEPKKKPKYYKPPNKNRWVFRKFEKRSRSGGNCGAGKVWVNGHYRNGYWVNGYCRRR